MVSSKAALYDEVIRVTQVYFGPATRRFVDRQIRTHIGVEPRKLRKRHLTDLIDWMGVAMALVTEDRKVVNSYKAELRSLTES